MLPDRLIFCREDGSPRTPSVSTSTSVPSSLLTEGALLRLSKSGSESACSDASDDAELWSVCGGVLAATLALLRGRLRYLGDLEWGFWLRLASAGWFACVWFACRALVVAGLVHSHDLHSCEFAGVACVPCEFHTLVAIACSSLCPQLATWVLQSFSSISAFLMVGEPAAVMLSTLLLPRDPPPSPPPTPILLSTSTFAPL